MSRGKLAAAAAFLSFVASTTALAEDTVTDRHRRDADRLISAALASDEGWRKITDLCDGVGHRFSGSPSLARAVDWAVEQMELDGLANVRRQRVLVPVWIRGEERAELVAPRRAELAMLGLGRSIGTPPGGIEAGVVAVSSFAEFDALPEADVAGRIVLWNVPFTTYSETVKYRSEGPERAAARGAVASLMRTVGRGSLRNPHTGSMKEYGEGLRCIPGAALAIEDAAMIARLLATGEDVRVRLSMGARTLPDAESFNVIAEVPGAVLPEDVVVIGGHLDSWDVGQGAHDDAGGCVVAMEAARLISELGLRPRRTIRVVLWTNEENGARGAEAYRDSVADQFERHHAAIEADLGVEEPWGFGVSVWKGEDETVDEPRQQRVLEVVQEIGLLLRPVRADSTRIGGGGADIAPLMKGRVPGLALRTSMELYWDIHHSEADTVDKVDPEALQRNIAAMAVMAYVLADLPGRLD